VEKSVKLALKVRNCQASSHILDLENEISTFPKHLQSQPFWVKKWKIQLPSAAPSGCATERHITVHGSH
jgi:hypothetical protein